jgi:hypothetical protein
MFSVLSSVDHGYDYNFVPSFVLAVHNNVRPFEELASTWHQPRSAHMRKLRDASCITFASMRAIIARIIFSDPLKNAIEIVTRKRLCGIV